MPLEAIQLTPGWLEKLKVWNSDVPVVVLSSSMKKYGCWLPLCAGSCSTGAMAKRACTRPSDGSTSVASTVVLCSMTLVLRLAPWALRSAESLRV